MKTYFSKIEAVRLTAENINQVAEWTGANGELKKDAKGPYILLSSDHNYISVGIGAWIIKDQSGIFTALANMHFERKYSAAQSCPGWVKASERLPGIKTPVKWRQGEREMKAKAVWYMVLDSNSEELSKCEWYDESGTAANELEELRQWKESAILLIDPVIQYAQGHPDAKLGSSCVEFVIERCKYYDRLKQRIISMQQKGDRLVSLLQGAGVEGANDAIKEWLTRTEE